MAAGPPDSSPSGLSRADAKCSGPRFTEKVSTGDHKSRRNGGDRAIAVLARGQKGMVSTAQLLDAGLSQTAIAYRVREGRLHRQHYGVYLVGHSVLAPYAREQAALLACCDSVLSHEFGAALWSLIATPAGDVSVTVVGRKRASRPGIRVHCVDRLDRPDLRRHRGLAVTAPARTLLDLGSVVNSEVLAQAVAEAIARRLVSRSSLEGALERAPRRRGAKALRELLEDETAPARTRSRLERRMLALVRGHGLPEPRANVQLGRWNVDFLWSEQRLIVETDSYSFHSSPTAWERDHRKQAELEDWGFSVEAGDQAATGRRAPASRGARSAVARCPRFTEEMSTGDHKSRWDGSDRAIAGRGAYRNSGAIPLSRRHFTALRSAAREAGWADRRNSRLSEADW